MSVATVGRQQQGSTRPLTAAECLSWLCTHTEGRLGYVSGRGPQCVVVTYAVAPDGRIVLRVPEYNEIGQYAPGEQVTLDVDGMTPPGDRQTVHVNGRAEVLTDSSVAALDGPGYERWPMGINTSTVALPLDEVHGTVQTERSSGAKEPRVVNSGGGSRSFRGWGGRLEELAPGDAVDCSSQDTSAGSYLHGLRTPNCADELHL